MEDKAKTGAIRLTNKTAIALRKNAKKVRHAWLCAAAVLTIALAALAVYVGMKRLIAVPITAAVAVLLDAAIILHARSSYLRMVGQAICTEAAVRGMKEQAQRDERRRQATRDLADMKQDALDALAGGLCGTAQERDEQADVLGVGARHERIREGSKRVAATPPMPPSGAEGAHRRRRQAGFKVIQSEKAR